MCGEKDVKKEEEKLLENVSPEMKKLIRDNVERDIEILKELAKH